MWNEGRGGVFGDPCPGQLNKALCVNCERRFKVKAGRGPSENAAAGAQGAQALMRTIRHARVLALPKSCATDDGVRAVCFPIRKVDILAGTPNLAFRPCNISAAEIDTMSMMLQEGR